MCVFQSERAIVKERELSLELARIRDEVGKWDRHTAPSGVETAMSHSHTVLHIVDHTVPTLKG